MSARASMLADLAAAADLLVDAEVVVDHAAWLAMSAAERAAIAVARRAWRARLEVARAHAASGALGRALVLAEDDGGAALAREEFAAFHAEAHRP